MANALPRITAELGASQSSYTWVIIAELLSMTATVPLWGKLSDLYSKKLLLQTSPACSWSAHSWPDSPKVPAC